jgi:hypothetical protein
MAILSFFLKIFSSFTFPMLSQKSPINPPQLPYLPTPTFWPWSFPVLGHIKFACPMGLSSDGRLGHLLIHMQLESRAPGYWLDPLSSLGTFSSSSIGSPVIHPIADCEHPLLCLLGPGIVSQETATSGSFR